VTVTAPTPTRAITRYTIATNTQQKVITITYVPFSTLWKPTDLTTESRSSPRLPLQLQQPLVGTREAISFRRCDRVSPLLRVNLPF
jgi:hypothetical protein